VTNWSKSVSNLLPNFVIDTTTGGSIGKADEAEAFFSQD
jgi:hypothetical protein